MLSGGDVPQLWSLDDTLFLGQGLWSRYYHCSCLSMKLARNLPLPSERHGNAVCTRQVMPCLVPTLLPCFTTSSITLNPIMRYSWLCCLPTRMGTVIGSDYPYSPSDWNATSIQPSYKNAVPFATCRSSSCSPNSSLLSLSGTQGRWVSLHDFDIMQTWAPRSQRASTLKY